MKKILGIVACVALAFIHASRKTKQIIKARDAEINNRNTGKHKDL